MTVYSENDPEWPWTHPDETAVTKWIDSGETGTLWTNAKETARDSDDAEIKGFETKNMETENLDISSLQQYAESLIRQIDEFYYESEALQTYTTGLENVIMFSFVTEARNSRMWKVHRYYSSQDNLKSYFQLKCLDSVWII